jgi:hypothetical protein
MRFTKGALARRRVELKKKKEAGAGVYLNTGKRTS